MKKQIVFTILFFITAILTAEDVQLRKIAQFQNDPNNNETISIDNKLSLKKKKNPFKKY